MHPSCSSCSQDITDGSSATLVSVGTLAIQRLIANIDSTSRAIFKIGVAFTLLVLHEMKQSRTASLSVCITNLQPLMIGPHTCNESRTAKKITFKNQSLALGNIDTPKETVETCSGKKRCFSPQSFTRTAPIPAYGGDPSGSCDASVKMNHVRHVLPDNSRGAFASNN